MQFQTVKLGGGGQAFSSTDNARLPFQFPNPIAGAYAILQSTRFDLTPDEDTYYSDDDVEVKTIEVSAVALFDALQSNTGGEVLISFRMPGTGSATSPDQILAEINVLVIGV
jgi:hypothetical protein